MEENRSRLQADELRTAYVLTQLRLPSVSSAVQGILDRALAYCADQMRLSGPDEALECLRQGDRAARWYCHHSLGGLVAEVLGDLEDTVQQVLVFDLEAPPEEFLYAEPGPTWPVHLVVEVQVKTEALEERVQALAHALAREYASVVGPGKEGRLLEIQVIDADDIEKRRGYVGLLGSLLNCPLQIWQR